jgi:hypothetical protein
MLAMLMVDEDFCNRLMDKCMIVAKAFAKAQVDEGCDLIGVGDAICSQIDVESYAHYVKSRHIELVSYIHSLGAKVKLHICGNTTHLLPHIADLGIDLFDPDHLVDQVVCSGILGKDVIRFGNFNPVFILDASKEEITQSCKEAIALEKGKKYILSWRLRVPDPATCQLGLKVFGEAIDFKRATAWTLFEREITVKEGILTVQFDFGGTGTVYLDDVCLAAAPSGKP